MAARASRRAPGRLTKRSSYHHPDLRRTLLDQALAMIARDGAAVFTMRELAGAAGVSHAAAYRHFRDKESLLATVAEEGFILLTSEMTACGDAAGRDSRARLRAIGIGYCRFATTHPGHFKVMFGHMGTPPEDVPGVALEGATAFQVLLQAIIQAQAEGAVRAGDPLEYAVIAWSGVHGLSTLVNERVMAPLGVVFDPEKLFAAMVDALLDGVATK